MTTDDLPWDLAARVMRRVLVDQCRARVAKKRGGIRVALELEAEAALAAAAPEEVDILTIACLLALPLLGAAESGRAVPPVPARSPSNSILRSSRPSPSTRRRCAGASARAFPTSEMTGRRRSHRPASASRRPLAPAPGL